MHCLTPITFHVPKAARRQNLIPFILALRLHSLQDGLLELTLNLLAGLVSGRLAVEREEVAEVELGCLEELDLADVNLKYC
jgi:hypothetical protein